LSSVRKYRELTNDIPEIYHYDELVPDPIIQNIGVDLHGKLVPRDALAYRVTLSNLFNMGVFKTLEQNDTPNRVLEIGAGYGALAHQVGRILRENDTYFIIDLPDILFWSAAYLTANNPNNSVYLYDPRTYDPQNLPKIADQYRFVLLPYWRLWDMAAVRPLDLVLNMISFQEMRLDQIEEYCKFFEENLEGYLYSDNQSVYTRNDQLGSSVEEILGRRFRLFPDQEFYTTQGLEWNIRRIYLAFHALKQEHLFIRKFINGYSYHTDGDTLTRIDDIFKKIKLS
jgi:hypothetical protein